MGERELIRLGHTLGTVVMLGSLVLSGRFRRKRENTLFAEEYMRARRQIDYLCTVLDKHDIELDEFDLIALSEL